MLAALLKAGLCPDPEQGFWECLESNDWANSVEDLVEEADGNTWEKSFDAANGFVYTLISPFNMTTKLQESFRN